MFGRSVNMRDINFDELYEYIRNDILEYGYKPLPRHMILRLKGMIDGQYMQNRNNKSTKGKYSPQAIYVTLKLMEGNLKEYIDKTTFNNDKHMINYIMKAITTNIDDTVDILNKQNK